MKGNDALVKALSNFKGDKKKVEEDKLSDEERTVTIPKKYLKRFKEGSSVSFKVLLEDGDNLILLPEESEEEESVIEIAKTGDKTKKEKKDLKTLLSEQIDKADKEVEVKGEK